jgi:hypothetical protein
MVNMHNILGLNRMKIKKGQITIFVIIAIAIVALIAIVFLLYNNGKLSLNISPESDYNSIQDCFKQLGDQALYYIGQTGGYYSSPEMSTEYGNSYYFYENRSFVPSIEIIENETSLFINEAGADCANLHTNNWSVGNITTQTKIYDDKVVFSINYPISVEKKGRVYSYSDFNFEIPGRVGTLYKASSEYIQRQVENPSGICINCINDLANKYNIKFITYNYDNDTIIFNLYDNNTKINNQDFYVYSFAVKYNENESLKEIMGYE